MGVHVGTIHRLKCTNHIRVIWKVIWNKPQRTLPGVL